MVGLVSDKLSVFVAWKSHAEIDKVEEGASGKGRLNKGKITVHASAVEKRLGKKIWRIVFVPVHPYLVIGLLVAASIYRSAFLKTFGDNQNVFDTV